MIEIVRDSIPIIRVIEFIVIVTLLALLIVKRKRTFRKLEIGIFIFQIVLFIIIACVWWRVNTPSQVPRCSQAFDCTPIGDGKMRKCYYCEDEEELGIENCTRIEITCPIDNSITTTSRTTTTTTNVINN